MPVLMPLPISELLIFVAASEVVFETVLQPFLKNAPMVPTTSLALPSKSFLGFGFCSSLSDEPTAP